MGRLIPAGTGFEYYQRVRIEPDEPPPPPPPSPEELELEREMEYFVEPDDPVSSLARALGAPLDPSLGPQLNPAPNLKDSPGGGSE